jgi:NAD(P)-dependent dehydrogenase (short-subunit alcohol dehydrogenase family)
VGANRSVLITGTSSGLGLSMAVHLAKRGWLVYASMRDPQRRHDLDRAVEYFGADPERIHVLRLDVTDSSSISESLNEIADQSGRLDALVNNAGVNLEGCLEDIDMADARRLFDTLVLGAIVLTRAALPLLRRSSDPRVIFISSSAAVTGGPTATVYSAAKAAIEKFAESLVWEVAGDRVRVIVLRPGIHRSDISHRNSGRVRPAASRYRVLYDRIDPVHQAAIRRAHDPMDVARKAAKALDSRHPRFRYHIGWDAYVATAVNPVIPHRLRDLAARLLFRPQA